jgi:thiamine pyrophosphate-dependent acetolactate synthase large subunit-like protein
MRDLVRQYLDHGLSRRGFVHAMSALGFTAAAAEALLEPLDAAEEPTAGTAGTTTVTGTGGELCVAQAKAAGAEYLFSNPGSFETGIYDAIADTPEIQMVMGLHEGVVIAMADGYHKASGKPAFVNVHAAGGTAQMGGQLYNASRDGSALVITAGLSDNEVWSDDSALAPRPGFSQKEEARPFTKISYDVRKPESIPVLMRRAFKMAATEPGGPVYVALAQYAQEAKNVTAEIVPAERFMLRTRVRPEADAVEKAAQWLIEAKRPLIIVGDEVSKSGAHEQVVSLSEQLGIAVASSGHVTMESFYNFPNQHPHFLGNYSMGSAYVKKSPDLIVFVGARDVGGTVVPNGPQLPPEAKVIRIGMDTNSMGRNSRTDLALIGDVLLTLQDLEKALEGTAKDRLKALAEERSPEIRTVNKAQRDQMAAAVRANLGKAPIHPDELGYSLARNLDPHSIVVSENITGRYDQFNFGYRKNEMTYFATAGMSLGWGLGASIGAAIGAPQRPVVCSIGDGSVMYSAPAFWSMARYTVPVLTVVWNNHNYQTVREAWARYKGKMEKTGHYPGMYLGNPDIDFVKLAESQGVRGEKVVKGTELESAIQRGVRITREGKPYVLDVEISRIGGGADSTWTEAFNLAEKRKRPGIA